MKELTNNEKYQITGGAVTTTIINSIARLINTIYTIGRAVGSTLRRATSGRICPI